MIDESLFDHRWDNRLARDAEGAAEMHVTALPGGHEEAAVLSVRMQGEV